MPSPWNAIVRPSFEKLTLQMIRGAPSKIIGEISLISGSSR